LRLIKKFFIPSKVLFREKAKQILEILGVRYIIFGHTHETDLISQNESSEVVAEYINSGTWTKSFAANHVEALLKEENEFAYLHIRYNEAKRSPKMELLRWVDGLNKGERVRLFEEKKI
jgi:hypothetical protein